MCICSWDSAGDGLCSHHRISAALTDSCIVLGMRCGLYWLLGHWDGWYYYDDTYVACSVAAIANGGSIALGQNLRDATPTLEPATVGQYLTGGSTPGSCHWAIPLGHAPPHNQKMQQLLGTTELQEKYHYRLQMSHNHF